MALLEDDKKNIILGIGIGLGVAALTRGPSLLHGVGRPLTKAVIKSGLAAYDKGREKAALWAEMIEDLTAEARAELEAEGRQAQAAGHGPIPITHAGNGKPNNGGAA